MTSLCIITHSYPRFEGDWRSNFIESLARAYARNNVSVTVLVPCTSDCDHRPREAERVRIVNYRYMPMRSLHTVGYGHSMKSDLKISLQDMLLMPFLILSGAIRLSALLRKERFDVIHAHWAVPNALIAVLGRWLASSRAVVMTSFPGSDVTAITRTGWLGRRLVRIILKSDYLSCNSSDLKEDLVKSGMKGADIDYVIYGVDEREIYYSGEERRLLRLDVKAADNDIVLLLVGRFVPKKGFSTAFRALRYIAARLKSFRLIVVGDGPLRDEYVNILKNDKTDTYVTFAGEVPTQDLRSYYSACDIFLMPSQRLPSDGLNVVVPEAMACGRPVVASKAGGNDLVVFPGVNGFLHDENDPKQLADFVIRLADDPALREEMGRQSLRLVRERFNWDAIAGYYLDRYREKAAGREARVQRHG